MATSYDCIIMGGGPAGSTAASLIAEAGFRTLLLERDQHPRFHIGESLMPETYSTFQRLGLLDKMKQSPFQEKLSVQFVNASGKESSPFYFHHRDPSERSRTWQVLRSEFDEMMWHHAGSKGAELRQQTRVMQVLMEGDRATGVRVRNQAGQEEEIHGRIVVDATGQQGILAHQLGLRQSIPGLRKAAVWGYYENARRDSGDNSGATLVLQTANRDSWFWYIPLHNNIVSIGVVGDVDYILKKDRGTPEEIFQQEIDLCPAVGARIASAKLVSEIRVLREFSYRCSRAVGDGWVMIGDAFMFLDPIYSSGVFLALKSGEMAADAIVSALQSNNTSAAALGSWVDDFRNGVHWIGRLVAAYYTREFSFGQFISRYPHHQGNVTDLLVGKAFHGEAAPLFEDLDQWVDNNRDQAAMAN